MGSLLYMTHPLCVSHYCGVVTAVGLRGGLGGCFLCMAIEDEAVDIGEHIHLGVRRDVGAGGVNDARATHRPPPPHQEPLAARSRAGLFHETRAPSLLGAGL